jgi:hypothetical protein
MRSVPWSGGGRTARGFAAGEGVVAVVAVMVVVVVMVVMVMGVKGL